MDIFVVTTNLTFTRWYIKLKGYEFTLKKKKGLLYDHLEMNILFLKTVYQSN